MKTKKPVIVISIIIVVLSLGLLAFNPMPASAQAAFQATRTPRPGQQQAATQAAENMSLNLQLEQNVLTREQLQLNNASKLVQKAQDLISKAQAKGVDVTALTAALDTFQQQVAAAQTTHDQAASILSAKNGFDANNHVTDAKAAHATLVSARDALRQTHLTLTNATLNLRLALQTWRSQHATQS
jgi:hypothetical protein